MRDDIGIENAALRSIIIKMPNLSGEYVNKGVIIITFTDTFRYYYYNVDIEAMQKYFHIVLDPSWAGYCLPEILFWTAYKSPVIVQATEITDRNFIIGTGSNLRAVEFGASDWVNYNTFSHMPIRNIYDSIYVANYSRVKQLRTARHRIVGIAALRRTARHARRRDSRGGDTDTTAAQPARPDGPRQHCLPRRNAARRRNHSASRAIGTNIARSRQHSRPYRITRQ